MKEIKVIPGFSCIGMKRKIQKRVYEEIKGLSVEEELAYYHARAERFWRKHKNRPVAAPAAHTRPEEATVSLKAARPWRNRPWIRKASPDC